MNKVQMRKEIAAIKRYLKKCCLFFGVGLMAAAAGFIAWGDGFFNEFTGTFLGKLPVYLLLGLWASGMFVSGSKLTKLAESGHRVSILDANRYIAFFFFIGPFFLFPAVVKRLRRLRELERDLYWS